MRIPTREEQRRLVLQWEETGRILERMRQEALKGKEFDWREVDALLEIGDHSGMPSRTTSGLIEMKRYFMKGLKSRE